MSVRFDVQLFSNDGTLIRGVSQYDINRVLRIRGLGLSDAPTIHLWKAGDEDAKCIEATLDNGDVVFTLPNEFTLTAFDIRLCVFALNDGDGRTICRLTIPVAKRAKPENYDDMIEGAGEVPAEDDNNEGIGE